MKTTIDIHGFRAAFIQMDRANKFTDEGLRLLFDYLEGVDPDQELNVIELCCIYKEALVEDIASKYDLDLSSCNTFDDVVEENIRIEVRKMLETCTEIIGETSDGFVYVAF
jgi:hypothetical protein